MFGTAATFKLPNFRNENCNQPTISADRPTKWKDVAQYALGDISCLLIHHLAAEWKQDVICLTFPVMNQTTPRQLSCGVSPQALLHTEEEGSGDVADRQPLWPPHRMELGRPHPERQTPEEPAVWVARKTPTTHTSRHTLYPEDHHVAGLGQDNQWDISITIAQRGN